MSLPDRAERTVEIDAPPEVVYDLVSDVTRMGEWSPETESFEAVTSPWLINFAERFFIRDRQQQLEDGIAHTLEAIKGAAEALNRT